MNVFLCGIHHSERASIALLCRRRRRRTKYVYHFSYLYTYERHVLLLSLRAMMTFTFYRFTNTSKVVLFILLRCVRAIAFIAHNLSLFVI